MNNSITKTKIHFYEYLIISAGVLIVRLFLMFNDSSIALISDRIGDLAVPSLLAGLDWSEIVAKTSYYGYGLKWIFFILFKVSDNPYFIYRGIHVIYMLLYLIASNALYTTLVRKADVKSRWILWLFIPIASFQNVGDIISSEDSLSLGVMVVIILIVNLVYTDSKITKNILSVVLGFFLAYTITLHTRAITLTLALFVAFFVDWIYRKKPFLNIFLFTPTLVMFYFLQKMLTSKVVSVFWASGVKNTSVTFIGYSWVIKSVWNLRCFVEAVLSNLLVLNIHTYACGIMAFTIAVVIAIDFFSKNKKYREFYEQNLFWFIILMVLFFTCMINILGVSFDWAEDVSVGNWKGYRGYIYLRYYFVFSIWMILPTIFIWFNMPKTKLVKIVNRLLIAFNIVYGLYFFCFLYENMKFYQQLITRSIRLYNLGYFRNLPMNLDANVIVSLRILLVFCVILVFACRNKNWQKIYMTALCVLSAFVITNGFCFETDELTMLWSGVYDTVSKVEEEVTLPKDIYCCTPEMIDTASKDEFTLQFALNRYSVHCGFPTNELGDAILVTDENFSDLTFKLKIYNYCGFRISDTEFIWVRGDSIIEQMISDGYQVEANYSNVARGTT